MLNRSIVPEGDGVLLPPEAALVFGYLRLRIEFSEGLATLLFAHALYELREGHIHIDALQSCDRVCSDHGMFGIRIFLVLSLIHI